MFALLSLLSGPAAAGPIIYTDWGMPTYDYSYLRSASSPFSECSTTWDELVAANYKAGITGNNGVDEYGTGYVYATVMTPPLKVDVYDSPSHFSLGSGWLTDTTSGFVESYSGQVVDIEPLFFDHVSCAVPAYPRWFVEVTTTTGSFLMYVR